MKQQFSKLVEEIPASGIRRFFELVQDADDIISLGVGEPDFDTPLPIRERAIETIQQGLTTYTSNQGMLILREHISAYLNKRFNLNYDAKSELLITTGVSEGADISLRSILNPDDEVLLPEPNYVCYSPLIHLTGAKIVSIDTSDTGLIPNPKRIEEHITEKTKAIVLCTPNNPTGMVIDKETLEQIVALAIKYDFWIITDEIYAELVYHTTFTSAGSIPGAKERTILLSGFSKSFSMTGWRIGFMAAPPKLIENAIKIHQYSALCTPITAQYAAIEALKTSASFVDSMKKSYEERHDLCIKRFNKMGLTTHKCEGAFYCFPSIKATGLSSDDFCLRLLKEEKVACVPGNVFGVGGEGHIRCCYAVSIDSLSEALDRIERFVKRQKGNK